MKADFTRDTFDAANHFRRVLHQQGRVTLDADPNEQAAILLHVLQTLARDLIGPYAAPAVGGGFQLTRTDGALMIGAGNYYVDGILVENDSACSYATQPDFTAAADDPLLKELRDPSGKQFWAYLDVWEQHVGAIEHPGLLEPALGVADTCTRSKIVWQVKALALEASAAGNAQAEKMAALVKQQEALTMEVAKTTAPAKRAALQLKLDAVNQQIADLGPAAGPDVVNDCAGPLIRLAGISDASLAARVDPGQAIEDACTIAPDAQYRGAENQLYRVEIHRGGAAGEATFKWARDNGSVATAWLGTEGNALQVSATHGFEAGNWVELSDDALDLQGLPGALVRLALVENGVLTADPDSASSTSALAWSPLMAHPKVRRWDQAAVGDAVLVQGAVPVTESPAAAPQWLDLEDGVQISFAEGGTYRSGDYWLIPARVASGNVAWPVVDGVPVMRPPAGILHHYAPLGFIGGADGDSSCRCEFTPLRVCP